MSRPSAWALAKAADHLFGDNFPSGAEVHIDRLAVLLDAVRAETISEIAQPFEVEHTCQECGDGTKMLAPVSVWRCSKTTLHGMATGPAIGFEIRETAKRKET